MQDQHSDIAPGSVVRIGSSWSRHYRKPGGSVTGVVSDLSPTGAVARVRMDEVADSYVLVDHLRVERPASRLALAS